MEPARSLMCPQCGSALPPPDAQRWSTCDYCGCTVRTSTTPADPADPTADEPQPLNLQPPKGWTVHDDGRTLTIQRRWFSWIVLFLIPFALFWNGIVFTFIGAALSGNAPIFFALFPLLHLAVGLGLIYFILALLFNRTRITLDAQALTVRHEPLPWRGNCQLDPLDIAQLYCKRRTHHTKNGTSYSYEVRFRTQQGQDVSLLRRLPNDEGALYLERLLEKQLGIRNEAVAGAWTARRAVADD